LSKADAKQFDFDLRCYRNELIDNLIGDSEKVGGIMSPSAFAVFKSIGHAAAPPASLINSRHLIAAPKFHTGIVLIQTSILEGPVAWPKTKYGHSLRGAQGTTAHGVPSSMRLSRNSQATGNF
jgi:hypothetical protein